MGDSLHMEMDKEKMFAVLAMHMHQGNKGHRALDNEWEILHVLVLFLLVN